MVSKEEWKKIYNNVFNIFPPSETLNLIIRYKSSKQCIQFNNIEKFFIYLCLNSVYKIQTNEIEYIVKDEKMFNKMNDYISKLLK